MTDSVGRMLFSVPDGGIIRMLYGNGEDYFAVCHYLDETHAEIDGNRLFLGKACFKNLIQNLNRFLVYSHSILWNRLFYRAVVRSEYRAYQPYHSKERRRLPVLSQLECMQIFCPPLIPCHLPEKR